MAISHVTNDSKMHNTALDVHDDPSDSLVLIPGLFPIRPIGQKFQSQHSTTVNSPVSRSHSGSIKSNESYHYCQSIVSPATYNVSMHVGAVFLIFFLGFFACTFPLIVKHFPSVPVPRHFLFLCRHFGTGVLLATAFIHLLPTAFSSLTDQCLPAFFNHRYPALAGLISLTAVLIVSGAEMIFTMRGLGHAHSFEYSSLKPDKSYVTLTPADDCGAFDYESDTQKTSSSHSASQLPSHHALVEQTVENTPNKTNSSTNIDDSMFETITNDKPSFDNIPNKVFIFQNCTQPPLFETQHCSSSFPETRNKDQVEQTIIPDTSCLIESSDSWNRTPKPDSTYSLPENGSFSLRQAQLDHEKKILQLMLLEAGILFHSVFIGLSLSVTTGTPFLVLLIAVGFHQTFEGLALGSRIAAVRFPCISNHDKAHTQMHVVYPKTKHTLPLSKKNSTQRPSDAATISISSECIYAELTGFNRAAQNTESFNGNDFSDEEVFDIIPSNFKTVDNPMKSYVGRWQPWLMCLAFGTTTPVGQLLGLLLRRIYDPASAIGLIAIGVTNAVSSGLLLFSGLVSLLAQDFLSEESYQVLHGRSRIQACISVVTGAALMALVGAWA